MGQNRKSIVVVVGMHRSGTSLCSHILNHLGYDITDHSLINSSNAKGHWERIEIVSFHDRILDYFNRAYYSPFHAFSLPAAWWTYDEVKKIRDEIISWLRIRMENVSQFGFKDPRICLMFPLWKEIFQELDLEQKYIFCVRDPVQVIRSIKGRDGLDSNDAEYRWVRYNAHALMGISNKKVTFVNYNDWFVDPSINLSRLLACCESTWQLADPTLLEAIGDIIAPDLRHDQPNTSGSIKPFTQGFYKAILESTIKDSFSSDLTVMYTSFVLIEQLSAYKQAAFTSPMRDFNIEKAACNDPLEKLAYLESTIRELQVRAEQELNVSIKLKEEAAILRLEISSLQSKMPFGESLREHTPPLDYVFRQ